MCIVTFKFREGKGSSYYLMTEVRHITLVAGEGYLSALLRKHSAWLQLADIVPYT
jgi:hypothetical protein